MYCKNDPEAVSLLDFIRLVSEKADADLGPLRADPVGHLPEARSSDLRASKSRSFGTGSNILRSYIALRWLSRTGDVFFCAFLSQNCCC